MRVKFNALHKDSSACYSEVAEVETKEQYLAAEKEFCARIPFTRFYTDHENESGEPELNDWIEE